MDIHGLSIDNPWISVDYPWISMDDPWMGGRGGGRAGGGIKNLTFFNDRYDFSGQLGELRGQSKIIFSRISEDVFDIFLHFFGRSGIDPGVIWDNFWTIFDNFWITFMKAM